MTTPKKPGRRWYQFRLRTLFVTTLLLTFPMAWLAAKIDQRRREAHALEWVDHVGGGHDIWYDSLFPSESGLDTRHIDRHWLDLRVDEFLDSWFGKPVRYVSLTHAELPVADITRLADLRNVERLDLDEMAVHNLRPLAKHTTLEELLLGDTPVTDLTPIAGLHHLRVLMLYQTKVEDLSALSELRQLQELRLNETLVRDLTPLSDLTKLEYLILESTRVSDIRPLRGLVNLKRLSLFGTDVRDLTPLAGLHNLRELDLRGTQLSDEQVRLLQKALPNCTIAR